VQTPDERVDAPLAIAFDEHFRIRLAGKNVAARFEFRAQLAEVVDRAVEDDADRAVLREHRLSPGLAQIEDGEAAMRERAARRPTLHTFAVRPAPRERANHPRHGFVRRLGASVLSYD
jgi:hypothetical protein